MSRLGVDTGGTFTDFVWRDEDGRWRIHKQLSTPADPAVAILAGIDVLAIPPAVPVVHGSTVATNALLERRGARTALITTRGFADILAIGRQNRPDLYALVPQKPPPLVPDAWRFEVDERVTAGGVVQTALDRASLEPIGQQLLAEGIESVAVCLLFSFLHPAHEKQIAAALAALPADPPLHISLSSIILPEYREYERTAATVINAYVAPLMSRYLARLARGLGERPLTIMQSNGGVISAAMAGEQAARTALSGPAGGVVGARYVAGQSNLDEIITFDMGGTSTDVALCPARLPATADGEIAGLPLRLPIIDIHTVGAGGGSLARVDPGGVLHVGPQSAGADPGPVCYGRAAADRVVGTAVTVTDANLVLGRLDPGHFLGGTMRLEEAAARAELAGLAAQLGRQSPEQAAWDVIRVANATMERAIRRISVERGHDPRRFTLVAFGGAGPLHAPDLAPALGIPRVLVPAVPGVLSALGMLVAAPARDYSRTVMAVAGVDGAGMAEWLAGQFRPLVDQALAEMGAEGYGPTAVRLQRSLDMRYAGQSHELTIPLDDEPGEAPLRARFDAAHERRYGYHQPAAPVEIVTLRLAAVVPVDPPPLPAQPRGEAGVETAVVGHKPVWFGPAAPVATKLYDRARLRPGHQLDGPAIIFQYDTTTVVPPGWGTAVDPTGNLLISRVAAGGWDE